MPLIFRAAIVAGAMFLIGSLYLALVQGSSRSRWMALGASALTILILPLLVSADHSSMRFLLAIIGVIVVGKLYDLTRASGRSPRQFTRQTLTFLFNPFSFVQRRLAVEPVPSVRENATQLFVCSVIFAAPYASMLVVDWDSLTKRSFLLEHVTKTTLMMIAIYGGCGVSIALWRLAGLQGRAPMHEFFSASTPAEFWRRFNRLAGQLFDLDVFRPITRRASPRVAQIVVFAISGLVHEYAFVMAGATPGFQFSFFLIQGVGVSVTHRMRPRGGMRILLWMVTAAFMLGTSLLFFAGWNQIVPHYSEAAPAWMGRP